MECKICSTISKKKTSFLFVHKKIKYFQCDNCLFIFQNPLPSLSKIKSIYNKKYFTENYKNYKKDYKLRQLQYGLDKKTILKFYKDSKEKSILDYGCGNGKFLGLFRSKKFGYEFNKNAEVDKKVNRLSNVTVHNRKYDMIIMRGVIEHIPDFDKVVTNLSKCLKINGLFFITATPNSHNLTFFLSSKDFNQNHPAHLFHFNHVNLSLFFLKNDFLTISTSYQYLETPYANIGKDFKSLKKQLKNYKSKLSTFSPPAVGNMLSSVFKKMK